MANHNIGFDGFEERVLTFCDDETCVKNAPVVMTEGETVGLGGAGDAFIGVCLACRDGVAAVQMGGFVCLPYTGDAPDLGRTTLCADGEGGVKRGDGVPVTVVQLNELDETVGFIF